MDWVSVHALPLTIFVSFFFLFLVVPHEYFTFLSSYTITLHMGEEDLIE